MGEVNDEIIRNPAEIEIILKVREIKSKKDIFSIETDIIQILEAYELFAKDYHIEYGIRYARKWDINELKNAFNFAYGRLGRKLGGRKSKVKEIQDIIISTGWKILIEVEAIRIQTYLESKYAKSTIYEALRK